MGQSIVVISRASDEDFSKDFAALPRNYGSAQYFNRHDVKAIHKLVHENLSTLDQNTHFTEKIKNKRVLIKPNLVTVYAGMGLRHENYPESTDPRLLDAVISFLKAYTNDIHIVESSGRGVPTTGSFYVSGINRLAAHHHVNLVALEETPTSRYILPKAKVQKEIIIPEIFNDVVDGTAFYISMPKMKTNLYTTVTLGFKNAMGILPYNLRQRNHHYAIDQKLVDMLYLIKPDLTVIDGLIGGEGNCPAPVEPVKAGMIISGNHPVETDRVATRIMGFDPAQIPLMALADQAGFSDPKVKIIGEVTAIPFKPADPSLSNASFQAKFPNVKAFYGHERKGFSPKPAQNAQNAGLFEQMEYGCRGGCLATTRFAFDMLHYEGHQQNFQLNIFIGNGIEMDGKLCYLDHHGNPISIEDISHLPGKKLAVGACAKKLVGVVDRFVPGCMPYPNAPHMAVHQLTGTFCQVMSLKNRHLLPLLFATLRMCERRKRLFHAGHPLDCCLTDSPDTIETRTLTAEEQQEDFLRWEMPPLTKEEIKAACKREYRAVLATFLG